MTTDPTAIKITADVQTAYRALVDAVDLATDAWNAEKRRLFVKYQIRGKDEMDAFGFITRDPTLTR